MFSGIDFFSGKNASDGGGRPDMIRAHFEVSPGMFGKRQWEIPLFDDEGVPLWLVYPLGKRVDIAVLPLPEPLHPQTMYPINVLANDDLLVAIGMDVYILGYPFKIAPPKLPVWKRGSIASEPDLVRMTTNYMLVAPCRRTRPGHRTKRVRQLPQKCRIRFNQNMKRSRFGDGPRHWYTSLWKRAE